MTSKNSIYASKLTVVDIYCLNSLNAYIQPDSIPVVGKYGKIEWLSSIEFFSSISVPTLSTNLLNVLESVRPGISTLSTVIGSTTQTYFTSTNTGLGSIGYVSTQTLEKALTTLSLVNSYISATTLYDSLSFLGDMRKITDEVGPMVIHLAAQGSILTGGYVSTMNPGNYRIYKSTLRLQGSNYTTALANGTASNSAIIDIGGYRTKVVNTSFLRLDINANLTLTYTGTAPTETNFSTFLINSLNSNVVGTPVSMTFNNSNAMMANLSFLLSSNDLTPFPNTLTLRHSLSNNNTSNVSLRTQIPQSGGMFVTLDNTD